MSCSPKGVPVRILIAILFLVLSLGF
uniref:Uncharacterized protein n=1 Tax=Arundo donax TaxID=35708 RepID=A0A0A8Z7M9_ARUDO